MADLKRLPVKWVRDYIKSDYKLRDCCYICGSTSTLELHHLYSVSELFNNWCSKNKIHSIESDEHIKQLRVRFAEDLAIELSHDNLYTLCKKHHVLLHTVYGQSYSNHIAPRIRNWLELKREEWQKKYQDGDNGSLKS